MADEQAPIDRVKVLGRAMGDEVFLTHMVQEFLHRAPGQIEELRAAIELQDRDAVASRASCLEDSASMLCADSISGVAKELKQLGSVGSLQKCKKLLDQLNRQVDRLASYIHQAN